MSYPSESRNPLGVAAGFLIAVIFALLFAQAFGMFAIMGSAWNYFEHGAPPEPTLEDYDAVQSIDVAESERIRVALSDNPTMANYRSFGGGNPAINQVALTSGDGEVSQRVELEPGQSAVVFDVDGGRAIAGEYRLALVNYRPPSPGIFGSPEREDSEIVSFTVEDGAVTVNEVPHGAASWNDSSNEGGGDG